MFGAAAFLVGKGHTGGRRHANSAAHRHKSEHGDLPEHIRQLDPASRQSAAGNVSSELWTPHPCGRQHRKINSWPCRVGATRQSRQPMAARPATGRRYPQVYIRKRLPDRDVR